MWGGVLTWGAMPLFEKNLTKELFVDILQGFLLPAAQVLYAQVLYENGWWLQQDNDPTHTAGHKKTMASEQKRVCVGVAILQP